MGSPGDKAAGQAAARCADDYRRERMAEDGQGERHHDASEEHDGRRRTTWSEELGGEVCDQRAGTPEG